MQSLSQQLSQKTRKFIRAKIRQELDPGLLAGLIESEMHAALADALNCTGLGFLDTLLGRFQAAAAAAWCSSKA